MLIDPYRFVVAPSGPSLFDEIMADNPFMYLRLGEASGTTANNENGATDGTYSGVYTLGNPALYSGGPTCYRNTGGSTEKVSWPGTAVPTLNAMTHCVILKPAGISLNKHLITRDTDSGSRIWQWRIEFANIVFYNGLAGFTSVSGAHGMSSGVAYIIHLRVTSGGVVTMFVNGSSVASGTLAAANYGGSTSTDIVIGNRYGQNEAQNGDYYSEAASFDTALSDARILAHAQAGGFA